MKWTRSTAAALVLLTPLPAEGTRAGQVFVREGEWLRIVEAGRGQPVVLIPGLFGSAFSFRKVIGPLVDRGHRVLVVEPLGVGGSARPAAADYSLTAQADRLAAALEVLEVERAVVVAHAIGASMALRLAVRNPRRVGAIVSLDGGPAESAGTPGLKRAMRFAFLIRMFGGLGRIRGIVRSTLCERSADPRWVTDEVVEGYLAAGADDLDATLRALRGMARAQEPQALLPRLGEVCCPVRLVVGEAARGAGVSYAEIALMAERLASFSVDRVENAGHFVFEEEPQAVVGAIERAIASSHRAEGTAGCAQPSNALASALPVEP